MRYLVECRKKDDRGEITGVSYAGFSDGLPNKKVALEVFDREVKSGKWDAVYIDALYKGGRMEGAGVWYKYPELA